MDFYDIMIWGIEIFVYSVSFKYLLVFDSYELCFLGCLCKGVLWWGIVEVLEFIRLVYGICGIGSLRL